MFLHRSWVLLLTSVSLAMAFLILGATRVSAQQKLQGRKLALLVGVKKYDHAKFSDLKFPENDVEELGELLRKQNFQVVVLTTDRGGKDEKLLPTAANVKSELAKLLKNVKKRDLVLVGLAGHGIQPLGSDKAYFCPQDANPKINNGKGTDPSTAAFPETLVGINDILVTLDDSGVGQKLLMVDACRNDPGVRGRRDASGVDRVNVLALPPETGILLSCSRGQFAFEHKSWGKGGHGAFFAAVIEGLSGKAAPGEKVVTWDRLVPYVREQVPTMVEQVYGGADGGEQRPNLIANISEAPAILASVTPVTPIKPQLPVTPEPSSTLPSNSSANDAPPLAVAPFDTDKARQHQQAWARHLKLPVELTNKTGMDLRLIPPGEFQMGSEEDTDDLFAQFPKYLRDLANGKTIRDLLKSEQPAHKVRITKPFYLGKYEVSKGEFQKFVDDTNHRTEAEKDGKGGGAGTSRRRISSRRWSTLGRTGE